MSTNDEESDCRPSPAPVPSDGSTTFVTSQQAAIHAIFERTRSMSDTAREMNVCQIRVREALVQWQRNRMRDMGLAPPPLREMMRGDVVTRFGVPRSELWGRPAKHRQDALIAGGVRRIPATASAPRLTAVPAPASGTARLIVTAIEPGARVHAGFWRNLQAYAARTDARLVCARVGEVGIVAEDVDGVRASVCDERVDIGGAVDLMLDRKPAQHSPRPLDTVQLRGPATFVVVPHWAVQLETLPRLRSDGLRVAMTTGAATLPRAGMAGADRRELGAVVVEVSADGAAHCRHVLSDVSGDGTFQDLRCRVRNGMVTPGCRVEAVTFGDIHHAHLDPVVAAATWGIGARGRQSLVDFLRPRRMLFHDVIDFDSRNHHDARDHLRRFAQMAAGGGDVRREMAAAVAFLERTRRPWAQSVIVGSNHDAALLRWLREADFRDDPGNAVFFLQTSLALHRRLAAGRAEDGFFEHVLRQLSPDRLSGIRFLKTDESYAVAGVECSIHGHRGADGKRGDMRFFERLGMRATLGHVHRPTTRGDIYCTGVCQTRLRYARGPLTGWATGHVVTYLGGSRQHLLLDGGALFRLGHATLSTF